MILELDLNNKVVNTAISASGILGTLGLIGTIIGWLEKDIRTGIFKISISLLIVSIILFCLFRYKKSFADLYSTLNVMAENNKLHLIRAMVMTIHKEMHRKHNKIVIKEAKFTYEILYPNISCQNSQFYGYDVRYTICFNFKRPLFFYEKKRRFSFYIICDSDKMIRENKIKAFDYYTGLQDVSSKLIVSDNVKYDVDFVLNSVTTRGDGQDHIERYSGLYEVTVILPNNVTGKEICYELGYTMKYNLSVDENQYNFAIIPSNYSKKIRRLKIDVISNSLSVYQMCLQEIDYKNGLAIVESFKKLKYNKYTLCSNSIKPKMRAAYIIQFNYLHEQKQQSLLKEDFKMDYRKATINDIPLLVNARLQLLQISNNLSLGSELNHLVEPIQNYYLEEINKNTHVAYLAFIDNNFVGTGGICFYQVLPTFHNPSGWKAYIINMYTKPEYRKRGIAGHILDLLIKESLNRGIDFITLEATNVGRPLYEQHGFVLLNSEMQLKNDTYDPHDSNTN